MGLSALNVSGGTTADYGFPGGSRMAITEASEFFQDFIVSDLLYGTQIDRDRYDDLVRKKAKVFTIDQLTRELDTALRGWGVYAGKITQQQYDDLPENAQLFLVYAQKCGPFWAKMRGQDVSNYTKAGVRKGMPDYGGSFKDSDPYFRAKCKAGIGFVIDNGFTIRFVLDSLYNEASMETIARKESSQPWHTGSELRYLYRKRDDARTQKQVVFYVDGNRVSRPWEVFSRAWSMYGQTRIEEPHVPESARR